MPVTWLSEELRPLCYEHHAEMRLNASRLNGEQETKETLVYGCTEPDCFIHYSTSRGYFVLGQNGNTNELDMVPSVRCFHGGMPMYLAGIDREKTAFRLWKCPQCGRRHTNEEGLVGLTSQEVQEVSGTRGAEPQTPGTAQI
jgi:hypothetical protein